MKNTRAVAEPLFEFAPSDIVGPSLYHFPCESIQCSKELWKQAAGSLALKRMTLAVNEVKDHLDRRPDGAAA